MKKTVLLILAIIVVALFCAGFMMLFGHLSFGEALLYGFCGAIAGALSPVLIAWLERVFRKQRQ